mgnify:CR=1 FL=1
MSFTRVFATLLTAASLMLSGAAFAEGTKVLMKTSAGEIVIELYDEKSPLTVENFLSYVDSEFYSNTVFHRVIPDFMIQGGGFDQNLERKQTQAPIKYEPNKDTPNYRGTIAMARTNDPDSATSQFFINTKDNLRLDGSMYRPGYAVFGKVVSGMEVVDAISSTPTKRMGPHQNVPAKAVIIESVTRQ